MRFLMVVALLAVAGCAHRPQSFVKHGYVFTGAREVAITDGFSDDAKILRRALQRYGIKVVEPGARYSAELVGTCSGYGEAFHASVFDAGERVLEVRLGNYSECTEGLLEAVASALNRNWEAPATDP